MIFIIGTRFLVSGSGVTNEPRVCAYCGAFTPFLVKNGRNFLTLFFVIPILPLGAKKPILECPNCKARYDN